MGKKGRTRKMRLVLTGGHAGATAYATIQEIKRRDKKWEMFWIGTKSALEGKKIKTLESQIFPRIGVKFLPLFTGRVQRTLSVWTVPSLIKIPFGILHAFFYLLKIRPKIVVSFGGYAAFPVVTVAWLLRIPVVVHEQTAAAGLANLSSSLFATKITLARNSSLEFFPKEKCVVVGNPVSREIRGITVKTSLSKTPTLFITGGSRGSARINNTVDQILEELLGDFFVIHQVGEYQYEKFKIRLKSLPRRLKKRYKVYSVIFPWDWWRFIRGADIIVSRAGANICAEIMAAKRPTLLIPLHFAYKDEQLKNALYAKEFGIAYVLPERKLSTSRLLLEINKIKKDWQKIIERVSKKASPDIEASKNLVDEIEKLI